MKKAQLAATVRLELRKHFFRLRGFWVYLLAFAPVLIIGTHAAEVTMRGRECNLTEDTTVMAAIFQLYYLRLGIFFGCMGIFTRLFRGDVIERSLHYYLLAPVRREVVVLGKFIAGVSAASFFFSLGVLAAFLLMFGHHRAPYEWGHLTAYLGTTVLACFGYGALFLLTGILFRNPIIPAVLVMLWESINELLPSLLKKFSVIFYLKPLCPVEVPLEGIGALFAVSAEPISPWLAVPGLVLLTAAILAYACWRMRQVEIDYGTD